MFDQRTMYRDFNVEHTFDGFYILWRSGVLLVFNLLHLMESLVSIDSSTSKTGWWEDSLRSSSLSIENDVPHDVTANPRLSVLQPSLPPPFERRSRGDPWRHACANMLTLVIPIRSLGVAAFLRYLSQESAQAVIGATAGCVGCALHGAFLTAIEERSVWREFAHIVGFEEPICFAGFVRVLAFWPSASPELQQ